MRQFDLAACQSRNSEQWGRQMLWTEEAVEVLKSLALQGRSASVIAAALGAPSRNAVIGKANRIGIKLNGGPGGAAPGGMHAVMHRAQAEVFVRSQPAPVERSSAPALSPAPKGKPWTFADAEVGEMRRARIEEIHKFACRWPLGDPTSGDFAYCGLKAAKGRSYCAGHCRMAYQPPKAAASRGAREWRRSSGLASSWGPR
jgi:GcrA cell cycle regulator